MLEFLILFTFVAATYLAVAGVRDYIKTQRWIDERKKKGMWLADKHDRYEQRD